MLQPYLRLVVSVLGVFALLCSQIALSEGPSDEFPGRQLFPDVPYTTSQDFHLMLKSNKVQVVDVRSPYEFETLHINGAVNIPVSSGNIDVEVQKLRESNDRQITVYCDDKTCLDSYKVVRNSIAQGIQDIVAYDAGILDFAQSYPGDVALLGKNLGDAKKLISKEQFKQHLISPDEFSGRVADTSDIVLDVRDRFQREGLSVFIGRESRVSLDNKKRLDRYIAKAQTQKKTLLIYDQSGVQVRWLQYYLEEKGVSSYYFMNGGMHAYYETIQSDLKK